MTKIGNQESSPGFWRRLFGFLGRQSRSSAKSVSDGAANVSMGMVQHFLKKQNVSRLIGKGIAMFVELLASGVLVARYQ